MISDAGVGGIEGWQHSIDKYSEKDVCTPGAIPVERLPNVLHYCKFLWTIVLQSFAWLQSTSPHGLYVLSISCRPTILAWQMVHRQIQTSKGLYIMQVSIAHGSTR